jgi:hypothetical protein
VGNAGHYGNKWCSVERDVSAQVDQVIAGGQKKATRLRCKAKKRRRLTTARMKAFTQLPADQQERITKTRQAAYNIDRGVLEQGQRMVDEIMPSLPEAEAYQRGATGGR